MFFEALEDRRLLAAFTGSSGNPLVIDLTANNSTLGIVAGASAYTLTLTGGDTWTSGDIAGGTTGSGGAVLTVTKDFFTQLDIGDTGTGTSVTFNNSGANTYSDTINVILDSLTASTITFNGASQFAGTSAISASTARNIVLNSGSSITTVDGGITLKANEAGTTPGLFDGIRVQNSDLQTTGTGNITLDGTAGGDTGMNVASYGVLVGSGSTVTSTATGATAGTITLDGTAANVNLISEGVYLTGSGTRFESVDGAIVITGTGGAAPTGGASVGVILNDLNGIYSTGTTATAATIDITGVGRNGAGDFNTGVYFRGPGVVSSVNGAISVTGTGGNSSGNNNDGIRIFNAATVQVNDGLMTLNGLPGSGNSAGVILTQTSGNSGRLVSTGSGGIKITADGNGTSADLVTQFDSVIGDGTHVGAGTSAVGDITINADSIDFSGTLSVESDGR